MESGCTNGNIVWFTASGHDCTIPSLDEAAQNGGNVSGVMLTPGVRMARGVKGTTQLMGLMLGGINGAATDAGVDASIDIFQLTSGQAKFLQLAAAMYGFGKSVNMNL